MNRLTAILSAIGQTILDPFRDKEDRGFDTKPQTMSIQAGPLKLSPESISLIIEFEVGGKAYYEKRLQHPTWPGGDSGITIGFGYDIGYNTPTQVHADWDGLLTPASVERLARDSGVKGTKAKALVKPLAFITVPWDAANEVFATRTLPRFAKLTAQTFPGIEKLHPNVQGALVSLVFNRGSSLDGERRSEMRAIRDLVARGAVSGIPAQFRKMKRLWMGKGLDGLIRRREAEAKLIESAV